MFFKIIALDQFLNTNALMRLRCDGIFNDEFITQSLLSMKVKE